MASGFSVFSNYSSCPGCGGCGSLSLRFRVKLVLGRIVLAYLGFHYSWQRVSRFSVALVAKRLPEDEEGGSRMRHA